MEKLITINSATKTFKGNRGLKNVSFNVFEGELVAILGPSGSGKTTLFNILLGLFPPESGVIKVFEKEPHLFKSFCRNKIGIVPQEDAFYPDLSVFDNILLFASFYDIGFLKARKRGKKILKKLGIYKLKNNLAKTLSGGEKKRLNVALSLLHRPKILLLDEPSVGLDPKTKKSLWKVILSLKNKGISILVITHLLDELKLADKLVVLGDTGIRFVGKYKEVITKAKINDYIRLHIRPLRKSSISRIEDYVQARNLCSSFEVKGNNLLFYNPKRNFVIYILSYLKRLDEEVVDFEVKSPSFETLYKGAK